VRLDAKGEAAAALVALHERNLERRLEDARVRAREAARAGRSSRCCCGA
jgi:hypothetical protein